VLPRLETCLHDEEQEHGQIGSDLGRETQKEIRPPLSVKLVTVVNEANDRPFA
jgi:hypothetical protein